MKIYKCNKMKKSLILVIFILSATLLHCTGQSKEATKADKTAGIEKAGESAETPIHLTKAEFLKRVMDYEKNTETWKFAGNRPCIVDFYADWCAPCRITSPILEDLAKVYAGKIDIYKVNVDDEQELASIFGVQSIPSFLFCPLQGEPTMSSGIANTPVATRQMFIQQIEDFLLKGKKNSPTI
jgi:thioredoxin 1